MTTPAISVRDLRKTYSVYAHPRDLLLEALTGRQRHREFTALEDVNFEVAPGSVTGLMGRNGAGKSTLLRIIAGTLDASSGTISTRGRTAAILELGTGFHPDYTGRENIYLGGMCLGLSRQEIDRRLADIIAFSELNNFIDLPFRTYSNGMQARLTFSVATCVDPDILIIDEALSVGDAKFQLKSFDRIRDFKNRGKAILFVSHSINQIVAICDDAILLEQGRIHAHGDPNRVGNIYHELLFGNTAHPSTVVGSTSVETDVQAKSTHATTARQSDSNGRDKAPSPSLETPLLVTKETPSPPASMASFPKLTTGGQRYGSGNAQILDVRIETPNGAPALVSGETLRVVLSVLAQKDIPDVCAGVLIRSAWGLDIIATDTRYTVCPELPRTLVAGQRLKIWISMPLWLAPGTYFLTVGIADVREVKHDLWFDCLQFQVSQGEQTVFTSSLLCVPISFSAAVEVDESRQDSAAPGSGRHPTYSS